MIRLRKTCILLLVFTAMVSISGCWDYREVDDMSIVAGVAIDRNETDGKYLLTVELVDIKSGRQETEAGFKMLSLAGDTLFDTVRNMISMTGKKLFWGHAKVIILSEEIAREGIVKVLDWFGRDTGTRADLYLFVSKEKTARELLVMNSTSETIMSFELALMMRDEKNSNTAPVIEIWDFIDKLQSHGQSALAPTIYVHEKDGQKSERVSGTAIFAQDKMIGTLTGTETRYMLFAQDKVKGGVLPVKNKEGRPVYTLEILGNRTKVQPRWIDGRLKIQLDTETDVSLDEVMEPEDFTHFADKKEIEALAENMLEENMEKVLHKILAMHSDAIGFGKAVHENMPAVWEQLKGHWRQDINKIEISVQSKVKIKNSAKSTRTIKMGD